MSVIKFCPKCGKWPGIGAVLPYATGSKEAGIAFCECSPAIITPSVRMDVIADAWNARVDSLLSEKDGRIADKEDTMEWVSCKDRLPDVGENSSVLAYYYEEGIYIVSDVDHDFKMVAAGIGRGGVQKWRGRWEILGITHWMPLPEPPKEDNDE